MFNSVRHAGLATILPRLYVIIHILPAILYSLPIGWLHKLLLGSKATNTKWKINYDVGRARSAAEKELNDHMEYERIFCCKIIIF